MYLKIRDRESYDFALASAAVALDLTADGVVTTARIGIGGLVAKPWRSREAEKALEGRPANDKTFEAAAEAALRGAKPMHDNAFKVKLAKLCIVRALRVATATT